jgi:hypothetical protein
MGNYDGKNGVVPTVVADKDAFNKIEWDYKNGDVPTSSEPKATKMVANEPAYTNGVVPLGTGTEDYLKGPETYTGPNDTIRYYKGEGEQNTYAKLDHLSDSLASSIPDGLYEDDSEAKKEAEANDYISFITGKSVSEISGEESSKKEEPSDDFNFENYPESGDQGDQGDMGGSESSEFDLDLTGSDDDINLDTTIANQEGLDLDGSTKGTDDSDLDVFMDSDSDKVASDNSWNFKAQDKMEAPDDILFGETSKESDESFSLEFGDDLEDDSRSPESDILSMGDDLEDNSSDADASFDLEDESETDGLDNDTIPEAGDDIDPFGDDDNGLVMADMLNEDFDGGKDMDLDDIKKYSDDYNHGDIEIQDKAGNWNPVNVLDGDFDNTGNEGYDSVNDDLEDDIMRTDAESNYNKADKEYAESFDILGDDDLDSDDDLGLGSDDSDDLGLGSDDESFDVLGDDDDLGLGSDDDLNSGDDLDIDSDESFDVLGDDENGDDLGSDGDDENGDDLGMGIDDDDDDESFSLLKKKSKKGKSEGKAKAKKKVKF